jgi:hypothetical protein
MIMGPYSLGQLGKTVLVAICAAAFAGAAGMPARAECPIDHARYRMVHNRNFTAGFYRIKAPPGWPSDLALFVRSPKQHRTDWFLLDNAALSRTNLLPTTDVRARTWTPPSDSKRSETFASTGYLALDEHHVFKVGLPTSKAPAPHYIMLPTLPEHLWYGPGDGKLIGENAPLDLFELSACAKFGDQVQ